VTTTLLLSTRLVHHARIACLGIAIATFTATTIDGHDFVTHFATFAFAGGRSVGR
jgi:hypothetical protein